ncbi:MAG: glycosyltransferase [Lachnospiraceae bacterium]
MTDIKYAVVITTYNREELLRECVDHVQHQTIPPDSIIIVNNASTDGTELYLKTLSEQDKTVNIINLLENTGGAGGFAVGIERAAKTATTWMLAIDDDAVIAIDYMEKIFAVAQQNPTYRAFAGAVTVNGKIDTCHRRKLTGIGLMSKNCKEQAYTQPCFTCDIASFCGMVVDLSLVRQIGLPHAEYFIWYDDTEYSLRIHRHSCFLVVPQAVLLHKIAQMEKSRPRRYDWKEYYAVRNRLLMVREHGTILDRAVNFANLFVHVIFRNWLFGVVKRDGYDWAYERRLVREALRDVHKVYRKAATLEKLPEGTKGEGITNAYFK